MRTAHYVISTHWDREWYEPLQGYRIRLVSLLDEVFDTLTRDPAFKIFTMDGQFIPVTDYLEVRPEKREMVERFAPKAGSKQARGMCCRMSGSSAANRSFAISNSGCSWPMNSAAGHRAPVLRAICSAISRRCRSCLCSLEFRLPISGAERTRRNIRAICCGNRRTAQPFLAIALAGWAIARGQPMSVNATRMKRHSTRKRPFKKLSILSSPREPRSPLGPILLFDGGDHIEIEPDVSYVIAKANEKLAELKHDIRIVHSSFDAYQAEVLKETSKIKKTIEGELRESGREPAALDEQWLIPGVYSSRIHLKQRNAACEDELCLFAEPISAFAAKALGREYPQGYLNVAWKHLLDNHPHDSICGCSPDQVHQDMIYRFDQSLGISSRLARNAMRDIVAATDASASVEGSLKLGVFNHTAEAIDRPVDLDIALPADWPKKFQEFFGFEEKFAFKLRDHAGNEIPYQLVNQRRDRVTFRRNRRKFPVADVRHFIGIAAKVKVPAFGYTTLFVEPAEPPTRYPGTMSTSHRSIENEHVRVVANSNGTIDLTMKRSGRTFSQLLTFEQRADIGDGWYHGIAVNDQIFTSTACAADIALVADGRFKATLRIAITMQVPESFDFKAMMRSERIAPLKIVSDVTLRRRRHRR